MKKFISKLIWHVEEYSHIFIIVLAFRSFKKSKRSQAKKYSHDLKLIGELRLDQPICQIGI